MHLARMNRLLGYRKRQVAKMHFWPPKCDQKHYKVFLQEEAKKKRDNQAKRNATRMRKREANK